MEPSLFFFFPCSIFRIIFGVIIVILLERLLLVVGSVKEDAVLALSGAVIRKSEMEA